MAFGTVWTLPSGHIGVEISRSGDYLLISRIDPGWKYPAKPQEYVAALCTPSVEPVSDEVIEQLREVVA